MAVCDGLIVCLEEHTNTLGSEEAVKAVGNPGATLSGDKAQQQDSTGRLKKGCVSSHVLYL